MDKPYKPNSNDLWVEKILDVINAEFEPIELKVTPTNNAATSECYSIVQEKIKKNGGKMILGWQIWKSNLLIEAEAHALWEDKRGKLWDITPKPYGIKSILFVEDDHLEYEGKQIDNIRLNITDNHLVNYFIDTFHLKYLIMNIGDRAYQHGAIILNQEELNDYGMLNTIQSNILLMLSQDKNEHSACFCGMSESFKECHGLILNELVQKYKQ